MALDGVSGRGFREAAIPGLTDTGTFAQPVSDPTGTKNFPSLTPAQSAANAKAAGAATNDPSNTDPLTGAAGGALGKTAFLQLLVQEMTNQDPLKPADNTQFIAQLAQFSTLEQMQNMNTGFTNLSNTFQAAQARGLLGETIHAVDTSTGTQVDGVADKILFNSGGSIQIDVNGTPVNLSDVLSVEPYVPPSSAGSGPSASLPGTVVPPTGGGQ